MEGYLRLVWDHCSGSYAWERFRYSVAGVECSAAVAGRHAVPVAKHSATVVDSGTRAGDQSFVAQQWVAYSVAKAMRTVVG